MSDRSEPVVPKLGLGAAQGQSETASQVASAAPAPAPSPQANTPRYGAPAAAAETTGGVAVGTPRYDTGGKAADAGPQVGAG